MSQGISGFVKEISGNQMPSPGVPAAEPRGIRAMVYVFAPTSLEQVERVEDSPFYTSIHTSLVDSVESDINGKFSLNLPPGDYSLFTKVEGRFYSNSFNEKNMIHPVTVEPNKHTEVNITVSAKAVY